MSEKSLSIEITGIHCEIDDETRKYVAKKCAKLIDYIPRRARGAAFANVKIEQLKPKSGQQFSCDAVLTLPDKTLVARDAAASALAAVDLVEAKLRGQIRRYKTEHFDDVKRGGLVARAKNIFSRRKD